MQSQMRLLVGIVFLLIVIGMLFNTCGSPSSDFKEVNATKAIFPSAAGKVIGKGHAYLGTVYFLTENGLHQRKPGSARARFEEICRIEAPTKVLTSEKDSGSALILTESGQILLHEMGSEGDCSPLILIRSRILNAQFDADDRLYLATEEGIYHLCLDSEVLGAELLWDPFGGAVQDFAVSDSWIIASNDETVALRGLSFGPGGEPFVGEQEFQHNLKGNESTVKVFFHDEMILALIETAGETVSRQSPLRQFFISQSDSLDSYDHNFDSLLPLDDSNPAHISSFMSHEGYLFANTTKGLYHLDVGSDGGPLVSRRVKQFAAALKESWVELSKKGIGQEKSRQVWFATGEGIWFSNFGGWPPTPESEKEQNVHLVKLKAGLDSPDLDEEYSGGGRFLSGTHYVTTANGKVFLFEDARPSGSGFKEKVTELAFANLPIFYGVFFLILLLLAAFSDWPIRFLCRTKLRDPLRLLEIKWSRHKALGKLALDNSSKVEIWLADLGTREEEPRFEERQFFQEVADIAKLDRGTIQEASNRVEFRIKLTVRGSVREFKLPKGGTKVEPVARSPEVERKETQNQNEKQD